MNKFSELELNHVQQLLLPHKGHPNIPFVQRFEETFCQIFNVKYAIACNSGTSALHAACFAAGIGPGDEVIIPGLTVVMDAYAVIHCGGIPVFSDINPETMNIDPDDIKRKITPKTKAIIPVSLQGLSVDIDAIMTIAKQHNLLVIEDTCQTVMGKYKGAISGTKADISCWSFENKKHITSGSEGGLITTNNAALAVKARKFAGIGYKHMTATAGRTSLAMSTVQNPDYERFDTIGLNYRMNEVSAAVGLGQLDRLDEIIGLRKACGQIFLDAVKNCAFMIPQCTPDNYEHSFYTFAVRYLGDETHGVSWRSFYDRYIKMGGDGFYGACQVPYLEPALRGKTMGTNTFEIGLCPLAEKTQRQLMQFKTNYRNLEIAKQKAEVLHRLIQEIKKG